MNLFGAIIIGIIILFILGGILMRGAIHDKHQQVLNPIRKDNSDYRFIQVEKEKTRCIFSKFNGVNRQESI